MSRVSRDKDIKQRNQLLCSDYRSRLESKETKCGKGNLNPVSVNVTLENPGGPGRTRAGRVLFCICVDNCFLAMIHNVGLSEYVKVFLKVFSHNSSINI